MGTSVLSDAKKDLFSYITEGNLTEVRRIITDLKQPVNCYDEKGMTPLQHAAFKGHFEICKLLLDCGADVNDNKDMYGYNPLSLAAISNHCDVIRLLLENGANAAAINSNKRTASEMAAFVGNKKAATVINTYVTKDEVHYFTEIHGLESEPKLPFFLSDSVHKLIILSTIHPVRIVLHLQSNNLILQNLKKVEEVLKLMSEKYLKEMSNERASLKLHHYAFVLSSVSDFIVSLKEKFTGEEMSDEKILDGFIKSLLRNYKDGEISVNLEKFLRKSISAYPFDNCLLFKKIASTISNTELGDEPNTFDLLNHAILGQQPFDVNEFCATCGNQGLLKQCLGCNKIHYCDKTCQKLHWFIHKNACKK